MARPLRGRLLGRMRENTRFHTKNGENRQVTGGVEEPRALPLKETEPGNGSGVTRKGFRSAFPARFAVNHHFHRGLREQT